MSPCMWEVISPSIQAKIEEQGKEGLAACKGHRTVWVVRNL